MVVLPKRLREQLEQRPETSGAAYGPKVGMEAFTVHDLRHYFESGLIADGCDVVTVQHALGHPRRR